MTEHTVHVPVSLVERIERELEYRVRTAVARWKAADHDGRDAVAVVNEEVRGGRVALRAYLTSTAEPRDHDLVSVVDGTTWVERNDGWQHVDVLDREIRLRRSRFHGLMVGVDGHWAYVGDDEGRLRDYLTAGDATSSAGGADGG